ncbi:MAG: CYTH domain-containing protein [Chitinophagales bacterium]
MEIERKFLVQNLPIDCLQSAPIPIEQGYLSIEENGNAVRLRRMGKQFFLTVKSSGTLVREERETQISEVQFEDLWESTRRRRVVKKRYVVPFQNLQIEVDVFEGKLQGLILAEVEFESVETAMAFQKLEWMDIEVTENPNFNNRQLQNFDSLEEVLCWL